MQTITGTESPVFDQPEVLMTVAVLDNIPVLLGVCRGLAWRHRDLNETTVTVNL